MTTLHKPPPLVPADVDLRDVPVPREAFAQAAVELFSIDIATARRWVNQAADRFEGPTPAASRSLRAQER